MNIFDRLKSPAIIFLLFFMALVLYRTTVSDLLKLWLDSSNVTYTHGALLLCVSIYLFYRRWKEIHNQLRLQPDILGIFLLLGCSLFWFLANLGGIVIVQQLLLITIFGLILWSALGFNAMRCLAFPIILIVSAIPVWEVINEGWLQKMTAIAVSEMMEVAGFSVFREGMLIHLPAGTFRVAQNCSGMRQLVAAITIGLIYSYVNNFKIYWYAAFILVLAILSFFINTLRIFIVVMAGQLTDMQHYFVREDHVTLGWVLFGIAIFLFIWGADKYHAVFRKREKVALNKNSAIKEPHNYFSFPLSVFLVVALISGPAMASLYANKELKKCNAIIISDEMGGWKIRMINNKNNRPVFSSADITIENTYENNQTDRVYNYIGYFIQESEGHELISSLNKVASDDWVVISTNSYAFVIDDNPIEVTENTVRSMQGKERLIWHWYYLSGKRTAKATMAKVYQVWNKLNWDTSASVILNSTEIKENRRRSREILKAFFIQTAPTMEQALDEAVCHHE